MPWPFGRKGGKAAKSNGDRPAAVTDRSLPVAAHTHTPQRRHGLGRGPSQRSARRHRHSSPSTTGSLPDVDKTDAALAKEAGHLPSSSEDITALPRQRRLERSPHLRPVTQDYSIPYNFSSPSHASLATARERGKLQRPQSLRATDSSIMRRMSSKRRREPDHVREEEIRTMILPMPQKRAAASSGNMLRRDSKKVKGALNHRFERPTSNVHLPLEDSIHSSMSGKSEIRAFRVSAFDMFSPRPTIRLSASSNYHYGGEHKSLAAHHDSPDSQRGRPTLSGSHEKVFRRTSRIEDLADTLDAGALREILERDKRRQAQKARTDQERLRRRLERRAEKQRMAEAENAPAPSRREATSPVGLGIERDMPVPMEGVRPSTPPQPRRLDTMPTTPKTHENNQLPTPLESPIEEPVVSDARAIRYSRGSVSAATHKRGASNISELPGLLSEMIKADIIEGPEIQHPATSGSLHPVDTIDTTASKRGSSRRSSIDGMRLGVFASLFRRGKRNSEDPMRTTPSETSFSNTSRETMSRQPLPAHLVGTASTPIQIRRPSSLPRRTMSKFREDLPESLNSPPDSRVQSPDVPVTSAIAARRRNRQPTDIRVESVSSSAGAQSDSPVSPVAPPRHVMSQSLASVDSEGSWLSGKPLKRASNKSQIHPSTGSSAIQRNEEFGHSYEELGMADDEYFKGLTSQPDERRRAPPSDILRNRTSNTAMVTLDAAGESDEEGQPTPAPRMSEEDDIFQSTVGRQPTIVNRPPRVKSTQGLLSYYLNDLPSPNEPASKSADTEPESPMSDNELAMVQRAKSVDLGNRHVRHLSAGSAKLLDIQKRSNTPSHNRLSEQY